MTALQSWSFSDDTGHTHVKLDCMFYVILYIKMCTDIALQTFVYRLSIVRACSWQSSLCMTCTYWLLVLEIMFSKIFHLLKLQRWLSFVQVKPLHRIRPKLFHLSCFKGPATLITGVLQMKLYQEKYQI